MRLKGLGQLENTYNNLIGIRTRNLSACSIVPQPITLLRAPHIKRNVVISGNPFGPGSVEYGNFCSALGFLAIEDSL
jgi:hypothetical protein